MIVSVENDIVDRPGSEDQTTEVGVDVGIDDDDEDDSIVGVAKTDEDNESDTVIDDNIEVNGTENDGVEIGCGMVKSIVSDRVFPRCA